MTFKRIGLLLFMFLVLSKTSIAGDELNSAIVEQKTYQLYIDKNWNELIHYGTNAIKQGFDYYYIRLRVGIAYYEKKNYNQAETHFKKALYFNSDEELVLEYLYYCYFFTGKTEDARLLSKKFSSDLLSKTNTTKRSALDFLLLESGTKLSDSSSYYNSSTKTSSNYFNAPFYLQLGAAHYIQKRVSLFHGFTFFNQETYIGTVQQLQYYVKAGIAFNNNWLVTPAFHYANLQLSTQIATLPPPPMPGMPPPKPIFETSITTTNFIVAALSVQKTYKNFGFILGNTLSTASSTTQLIHNGIVSYSPLGNSKLVIGCGAYLHTNDSYATTYVAVAPFVYVQASNRLSIKGSYYSNTGKNIIEDNGYLINNSLDLTTNRISILPMFTLSKRLSLYALYQFENKVEASQQFNYKYHILVAGLKVTL